MAQEGDNRSRKDKALDKLGKIVFGKTGEEPVGDEIEREINKDHGSSDGDKDKS